MFTYYNKMKIKAFSVLYWKLLTNTEKQLSTFE